MILCTYVSNAVKFSSNNDTITVFTSEEAPYTLVVRDTGRGIHPRISEHIFDYGFHKSQVGTNGETGTGLGLALSREIMELLGGSLTVDSRLGGGSTFYATLPRILPSILIVDDEMLFRVEQKLHLKSISDDITILEAENGQEALSIICSPDKPGLIITDISMPVMDGLELLERIKKDPETASIPVIVVTAMGGREIREEAFEKGADDFVAKPFEAIELIPRVKRFL